MQDLFPALIVRNEFDDRFDQTAVNRFFEDPPYALLRHLLRVRNMIEVRLLYKERAPETVAP